MNSSIVSYNKKFEYTMLVNYLILVINTYNAKPLVATKFHVNIVKCTFIWLLQIKENPASSVTYTYKSDKKCSKYN